MKLTIDNLDGLGAIDYSGAVDASEAWTIERTLNAPSLMKAMLCLEGSGLAKPVRRGRVVVSSDAGTCLFTGYLATEPAAIYAGVASAGPVYRLQCSAVSDEWLLDKQAAGGVVGNGFAAGGGATLQALMDRIDPGRFTSAALSNARNVGVFAPVVDASWSQHAGAAADASYGSYRVLQGALSLTPAGSVVHALANGDGALQIAGLRTSAVRELANDVTVTGELEPAGYWMEVFAGDGTTSEFELTGSPSSPNEARSVLMNEAFAGPTISRQSWAISDPGSHLALGAAGLTLSGGNGLDGQTTLTAWDALELAGACVLELGGVTLGAGSAGVLAGLYNGATAQANCFAGFNVRQAGGQTVVTPLLNGAEAGMTFTLLSGHSYTVRLRTHCVEMLRVKQSYYAMAPGAGGSFAVQQFGGGLVSAPMDLVFEVRDQGASSNTPVTVLYDSAAAGAQVASPAKATFVAVNSVQLFGSVASIRARRTGSCWIRSVAPQTGVARTRLIGKAGDGVDCKGAQSVTGKVTFFAGRIPAAGELVTITYRGRRRAVARVADPASLAVEAAGGGVGTARWLGRVERPVARCAEDCESVAAAILSFAGNRNAALTGTYGEVNPPADIWPGDALAISDAGLNAMVRRVAIEAHGAGPEVLTYRMALANDWAEGLGVRLSEAIAKDALLPAISLPCSAGQTPVVPQHAIANLQQLVVIGATGTGSSNALQVDAGQDPPAGGGFEVRRRDGGFGTGASGNGDMVLRSTVRGFSIPRAAMEERFFVRMYDGSAVPLYSRESCAIVTHLPLG